MLVAFLSAVGLMLVMEGMMPFLSPQHFRRTLATVAQTNDRILRIAGLVSMLAGVVLLYIVRGV